MTDTKKGYSEGSPGNETVGIVSKEPAVSDRANLKRYVHQVWRISQRRKSRPIDKKTSAR